MKPIAQNTKGLFGISALHFLNDLFPSFLPALMPRLVQSLSLSYSQAGLVNMVFGCFHFITQPVAGYLSDKQKKPYFALWSPLLTAAGVLLLPLSVNYAMLLALTGVMSLGTALFHPQGHAIAGAVAPKGSLAFYIAIMAAGGNFGFSLSPLFAVFLVEKLGATWMPIVMVPLAASIYAIRNTLPTDISISHDHAERAGSAPTPPTPQPSFTEIFGKVLRVSGWIIFLAVLRDTTSQGIRLFMPLLIQERGGSLAMGGSMLFSFTVAGMFSSLISGKLADRFGKLRVVLVLLIMVPFLLFPAVRLGGIASLVLFVIGGACLNASTPITTAIAQEGNPEARAIASSLSMGISWGIGNIMSYPIGRLGDYIGLETTVALVSLLPWFVFPLIALNRLRLRRRH